MFATTEGFSLFDENAQQAPATQNGNNAGTSEMGTQKYYGSGGSTTTYTDEQLENIALAAAGGEQWAKDILTADKSPAPQAQAPEQPKESATAEAKSAALPAVLMLALAGAAFTIAKVRK